LYLSIFICGGKGFAADLFSTHALVLLVFFSENLVLVLEYRSETVTEESRDERSKAKFHFSYF
jgi:hypothetical protein